MLLKEFDVDEGGVRFMEKLRNDTWVTKCYIIRSCLEKLKRC